MSWICLNDNCTLRFFSLSSELWEINNRFIMWSYNLISNNFAFLGMIMLAFLIVAIFTGFKRVAKNGI